MSENSTRHSSYLDDSGDNARRRAQINARRISGGPLPARANQSTADLRFEQASLIERSSRGWFVKHNGRSGWYFGELA